jgi:hypothetical protein
VPPQDGAQPRMSTHYVYVDPNKSELQQGDVLQRCDALSAVLDKYFPYYSNHADYRYFQVLTQTCDLVRRDDDPCAAHYISIAAVRPIKDVLLLEAARLQEKDLLGTRVISHDDRRDLALFLESLMDNNKPGFFYLHTDADLGISEPCCAFLQLAISVRAEHYDKCLEAKIAQLREPFQAKLGWLIDHMYSRVGTDEWNEKKPDELVGRVAASILKDNFVNYDKEQIKAALDAMIADGSITTKTPEEKRTAVQRTKLIPKLRQFKERAEVRLREMKIVEPIKNRAGDCLWKDEKLRSDIAGLFGAPPSEETPEDKAKAVIKLVLASLRDQVTDEKLPNKEKYINDLVADLMADTVLKSLIKP